jgi:hypothetical protein
MESPRGKEISDLDIRHFIYATFAGIARSPTTLETADHCDSYRPAGDFRLAGSLFGSRSKVLGKHRLYLSNDSRLQVEESS